MAEVASISREQLLLARDKLAEVTSNTTPGIIEGDIVQLPLGDARFDVVMCFGGPLSYASDRRNEAAAELVRVTRPGGVLLVSVMSRLGTTFNLARRPVISMLRDPDGWHIWTVLSTGDLPGGVAMSRTGATHPAMHLYTSDELRALLPGCDVLELVGSNVTGFQDSAALEQIGDDAVAWQTVVEMERQTNHDPGLTDTGSHLILAARRRE